MLLNKGKWSLVVDILGIKEGRRKVYRDADRYKFRDHWLLVHAGRVHDAYVGNFV